MSSKLIFKIISRSILLIGGLVCFRALSTLGWYEQVIPDYFRFVEFNGDDSTGMYTYLALRAIAITFFCSFFTFYLIPSILGLIYLLKIDRKTADILFFTAGAVVAMVLIYFLVSFLINIKPADYVVHLIDKSMITVTVSLHKIKRSLLFFVSLPASIIIYHMFLLGLYPVYKGKNMLLTDLGLQKGLSQKLKKI